ncbi:peptide/nickel transport system substrate-binding protein [Nitratireductor aquibiodomus]|uniref:Peptide/nickel transport system substrate-binding protein n=1 Tax=Nitratireductor aquibiodomus TaxID=204799 RepID=A0A1H4QBQ6_9HYPH|nr:ABC transporter substrate-binding protein [Nitratireductor aquibiodomus]SEC17021.1 peptide/nickel transport system substrate-binding protein [Nitratireductor aquibiodomus]
MLKRLTTLAAAMLVSTALHAEPVSGGRANVVIQPEPPSLMMGLVQNGPTQMVAGQIYEGLLRYDEKLQPMPQLAKSWEVSEDGLTYTFKLHDNVKWHDGKPFTSADVVFSADVFLRETHARLRTSLEHVESITAPDDTTVVFKLKQPFGPFLGIFEAGTMPMVPKHIYEGTDYKNNPANNTPIGTGPFKFTEWVKGSHILLTKFEDYYEDGKPYLDEIYWHVIPDAASRAVAYETGVVDILPGGSVENFDVQRIADMENTCITDKGWEYFGPLSWMWLNNREGPTADKRFRQAVMYAMDRNFARDALWNGLGKVAKGPVSSSTRFFTDDVNAYDHDPEKAKALLEEMGYDGETVRLLPLPYGETWQRWAEAVKQNLGEVGINVEIVSTDVAGWNQKLAEWDYDMAFTYLYQYGDPALGVARTYISTNIAKGSQWNNVEGYENKEIDDLFAKAAVAVTTEERQKLYTEVQQKLVDDVPVAWLLELGFPTIYRCSVKDLVTTAIGVNDGFKDAYIEK